MRGIPPTAFVRFVPAAALLVAIGCGGDAMRYDPEPYREHIESLENLIHKPAAERGDGGRIHKLAATLAGVLGEDIDNARMKEGVKTLLIDFGAHFSDVESSGGDVDLSEARAAWAALRDRIFQPADWFQ